MPPASKNTCRAVSVFSFLSRRWVLLILHAIHCDIRTFNALKKELGGISSRTLSERLKDLEAVGFVERVVLSDQPLKVEYRSTKKADSFDPILHHIGAWAEKWHVIY